jgi:4'-phosphopantetheinyl transferase
VEIANNANRKAGDMSDLEINWIKPAAFPQLEYGQVHLWAASLDQGRERLPALASILSTDERDRAGRFHFERDRLRFTVARAMLRLILGHYLRINPLEVTFEYGSQGKPAVVNAPPASALHFNSSHSEELALLAVTNVCPVGIDVERVRELKDAGDIARRFFSSRENAALNALPRDQMLEAFFDLWTRKEALLKATGEGLGDSLDHMEVLSPEEKAAVKIDLQAVFLSAAGWTFQKLAPASGFKAALAVAGPSLPALPLQWTLDCQRRSENGVKTPI